MVTVGQTLVIHSLTNRANGETKMVMATATIRSAMRVILVLKKEVNLSSTGLGVEIQTVMVGRIQVRIGQRHLGVQPMLSLPTDYNGKIAMKMALEMFRWELEETTALIFRELQPEIFKAARMLMVMAGPMNTAVGMLHFRAWVKIQSPVGCPT
jgi:hypothetical protein